MPMPTDIGVIDLMIGFPEADRRHNYDFLRANLRDHESLDEFEFPGGPAWATAEVATGGP